MRILSVITARFWAAPRAVRGWVMAVLVMGVMCGRPWRLEAQVQPMAAAPTGLSEVGALPFVILGAESLGLASPPTDIRLMPDGRVLVIAPTQLAWAMGCVGRFCVRRWMIRSPPGWAPWWIAMAASFSARRRAWPA